MGPAEGSPVQDHTTFEVSVSTNRGIRFVVKAVTNTLDEAIKYVTADWIAGTIYDFAIFEIPGRRGEENIPVFHPGKFSEVIKKLRAKRIANDFDTRIDNLVLSLQDVSEHRGREIVKAWIKENVK